MNILSLCDHSGNILKPWADAGHACVSVDLRHQGSPYSGVSPYHCSVSEFDWGILDWDMIFAFPPCTHTAVSGAGWFRSKGPRKAAEAFGTLADCLEIIERANCPWMVENPVSTFSTYWREPDHTFHPWYWGDMEQKKTCLWVGGGFRMPERTHDIGGIGSLWSEVTTIDPLEIRTSCADMSPSEDRGNKRSVTPMGFSEAVFAANTPCCQQRELLE